MSRIGIKIIAIPTGVTIEMKNGVVIVKGPKGELKKEMNPLIERKLTVVRKEDTKASRSLHGLYRSLISNMVTGVTKGFEKRLEIIGVGYRAQASGNKITLALGYSHPIEHKALPGIEFKLDEEKKNIIIISGIDKEMVGQTAAIIRGYRKPEPYKGKGIRYVDEYVARKAGKAAAKAAA
ncbi:MAG: 50S ribosomal protein L6 [Candidatus Gracilibacteria bacterium]|jgi:large subunit ribosomal protein L6